MDRIPTNVHSILPMVTNSHFSLAKSIGSTVLLIQQYNSTMNHEQLLGEVRLNSNGTIYILLENKRVKTKANRKSL